MYELDYVSGAGIFGDIWRGISTVFVAATTAAFGWGFAGTAIAAGWNAFWDAVL
jgi:hypothetical protein